MIDRLTLNDSERRDLKKEVDILYNLQHPNIMKLYEVYKNKTMMYLVTELCDGHDLYTEMINRERFKEN